MGVAFCGSCIVWMLQWGSCFVGDLQCEGVAVCEGVAMCVRELWCVCYAVWRLLSRGSAVCGS